MTNVCVINEKKKRPKRDVLWFATIIINNTQVEFVKSIIIWAVSIDVGENQLRSSITFSIILNFM